LKEKLPQETPATALRPEVKASAADWSKFRRYWKAANDPAGILNGFARGDVTVENMEVLETLYPEHLATYRQDLYAHAERLRALPYAKRALLQRILGPEALSLTTPQINLIQQTHQQASQATKPNQTSPDGRQNVNQENNMATQSQRMEAR
jgi:hypothetical protein